MKSVPKNEISYRFCRFVIKKLNPSRCQFRLELDDHVVIQDEEKDQTDYHWDALKDLLDDVQKHGLGFLGTILLDGELYSRNSML